MVRATRNIFLLFLVFVSLVSFSQDTYYVSGKVTDSKTKEPLAFVNIVINNSQYGGTTDIDGKFRLRSARPVQKLHYPMSAIFRSPIRSGIKRRIFRSN